MDPSIVAVLNGVQRDLLKRGEPIEHLRMGQVAKILFLHRNTVTYRIKMGRIKGVWVMPGFKRGVAEHRIPIAEVERLLEEQRSEAAARLEALGSGA